MESKLRFFLIDCFQDEQKIYTVSKKLFDEEIYIYEDLNCFTNEEMVRFGFE